MDCVVSDYSDWDLCSQSCGGGLRKREREVENLALQLRDATQWSDAIKLIEIPTLHLTYCCV